MDIFNLPDLGEGLPDAEIHEWFVKVGDIVEVDQPLASMETAKAVVDVPCPQSGVIAKLYGNQGDIIKTGEPLVGFETTKSVKSDKGTVVGNLEESTEITEDNFTIGVNKQTIKSGKATPRVRLLAKKLGVDLTTVSGSGEYGMITKEDVEKAAVKKNPLGEGFEPLKGVRRAMLKSMEESHKEVVHVSIFDEVDISNWHADNDITVRLIKAMVYATEIEPSLNAWYDSHNCALKRFAEVNLGLAMDNSEGLFVPVIHDAGGKSTEELRKIINTYKQEVLSRSIPSQNLKGATITLSNFGKFAGKFASPIIVVPTVAILGVGRLYSGVINNDGKIQEGKLLPLSLSFDHRAITGGEATRFLGAVIKSLQNPK